MDDSAPAPQSAAVLNPTSFTLTDVLGQWKLDGPVSNLNLVSDGPVKLGPGESLLVEKGAGTGTSPQVRIYFEE